MSRSHFLSLSFFAGLGSTLPLTAASSDIPRTLGQWARTHSAAVKTSEGALLLKARIPFLNLADGLHALANLCDGPMHAEGNLLRGSCQGNRFELSLG